MYMLDTNICIYIRKKSPPQVLEKLQNCRQGEVFMSVITFAELMYGALKSQAVATNLEKLQRLRQLIPVMDFDADAAKMYGKIRSELEKQGLPIGSNDFLIAAHALSCGMILVTNNEREFLRVNGLSVENWA
ncbi:type II toxin-antitoxin system tRNA(fMet)-specific endonuclease VapC [Candidatus Venteria ishoeyi]|uniref:tRNA(fMet)-specific endonuclease VapC n=1 Tax=Candidatus Venteria ishoeyi TaxID=1899563 RepID=A0A1H6FDN2_9GAMM|nr:type II toxin-antitoxin system VapC family toxin [Candidatus Venteria ishoeyi]SEH07511.1 tRNA(fMet)-specific endonuclease VapC [Candidatus Venteria ishoeyi]